MNSKTLESLIDIAEFLDKKGELGEEAISVNEKILELDNLNVTALIRLGKSYKAINEELLSQIAFEEALKIKPNSYQATIYIKRIINERKLRDFIVGFDSMTFMDKKRILLFYKKDFFLFINTVANIKERYNFKGLWHFTEFNNMDNIFKEGKVYSRDYCNKQRLPFKDGANQDVLNKAPESVKRCTRFYYRPRTPALYDVEGIKYKQFMEKEHIPIPVYLLFSEELIYLKETRFSNGNATNSSIGNSINFFENMNWKYIFHDGWFLPEDRDMIVNYRHAELLSSNPVELKYLKSILFRCETDLKRAINRWGDNKLYQVEPSCFSNKQDYRIYYYNNFIKDYYIERYEKLTVRIEFDKAIGNFTIQFKVSSIYNSTNDITIYGKIMEKYDKYDNKVNDISEAYKITLEFNYKFSEGDILKIFFNGVLSVEEKIKL